MNINNKLVTFAQQELVLSHNDTERDKIKASLSHLEKILKDKLHINIKEFVRFGSFTRNTILPRDYDAESDVDLMVVMNTDSNIYSPGTYRKWLLDVVTEAYPKSISKKDFPVVKLMLNHIMFDIVPAYCKVDFWGDKSFFIPGSGDTWRATTPNDINRDLETKNTEVGSNKVRNVIRLCKHWNASANYPLESYLMEKAILNITFMWGDDTYASFLRVLERIAGDRSGIRLALDSISKYKGDFWNAANEEKQLQWLQRLLPGLK
jgi:predicted nucleotidyltransferase